MIALRECVEKEAPLRPHEMSFSQVKRYSDEDSICANKSITIAHMDSIDLNIVPKEYLAVCKTQKEYYAE